VADYAQFSRELGFQSIVSIPMSARYGDNVTGRSDKTEWYSGPTLIEHLETVSVDEAAVELPFRFPVQYVNRPNLDFRGFAGTIASGSVSPGDEVVVAKSGKSAHVRRIVSHGGDLSRAVAGQAITLV
ncbi:MAG: adenylyl-sulfate kinase, partial [Mesorhizobium sp.]